MTVKRVANFVFLRIDSKGLRKKGEEGLRTGQGWGLRRYSSKPLKMSGLLESTSEVPRFQQDAMSKNWFSREAKSNGDEHKNINSDSRVLNQFPRLFGAVSDALSFPACELVKFWQKSQS